MSKLEDQVFYLKFTSKSITREANKCKAEETKQKNAAVAALKKNRPEVSRVYAENAIRSRNQYNNLVAMAAKIDAVASRVSSASQVCNVTNSLKSVVNQLSQASNSLDLEKMSNLMNKFEREFENMDVKSSVLDEAMSNTTTLLAPDEQVNSLLKQLADEANIDLKMDMPELASNNAGPSAEEHDNLTDRLAKLRN